MTLPCGSGLYREAEPSLGEVPAHVGSRETAAAEMLGWESCLTKCCANFADFVPFFLFLFLLTKRPDLFEFSGKIVRPMRAKKKEKRK